jgi:toxin HigB-1
VPTSSGGKVISSFRCRDTQALFEGKPGGRFGGFARVAFRKLAILDAAGCLNDLQIPPGNRLEPLRGNRHGQHRACLRKQCINDQFRLCFVWTDAGPEEVEIVDYH